MMDDVHIARNDIERAAIAKKGSPYLTTKQAAHYLGLSPRTLEKMRAKGVGPKYHRIGRCARYLVRELDADWPPLSKYDNNASNS